MRVLHAAAVMTALAASGVSAQSPADIEAGAQLYEEHCQICHGERLRNTGQGYDLKQFKADERGRFDKSVLGGKGQMPSWQGVLEAQQIDQIWAYIRANAYE
ncbi:MAG: hypothetical protein RLZ98_937 [Pseudomonadota bacterium]|jgi:mono/diheme cytochrome c family protein